MQLGFRSSFNFIPEGDYATSKELREELTRNGFEVAVHDLHHDGKLYRSRKDFIAKAARINQYLRDWGAVGFRSGFMLRNLAWLHDLDVQYDASTFDTDPFEPQPDGVGTIFPFWVPRPREEGRGARLEGRVRSAECGTAGPQCSASNGSEGGYVELPYTLPQDLTLFVILGERTPDIWFQKLDWIAKHGGMALLDVHPDYMRFNSESSSARTFPADFYARFLEYARQRYGDSFWHPLPKDLAAFAAPLKLPVRGKQKPKIWIDLDNTPHVPFFEPILEELEKRGFPVLVTARDAFQVCDLARKKRIPHIKVGRHYGRNRLLKATGLAYRALQLARVVLREKPVLAVSHGARAQILLSNCLRIPTLLIEDYEYAQFPPMMRPRWLMAPSVIPDAMLLHKNCKILKYPGIKEDVYAWKLKPDPGLLKELGLCESDVIITVRPPATEAHYHNPESEKLFEAFMERGHETPQAKIVLLPRNKKQIEFIRLRWPKWFDHGKTVIPNGAVDGLSLIWLSDLVVSGGGTMNREAAALGVPVYSIFRGHIGAVDKQLEAEGRLVLVESVQEVHQKIILEKRMAKSLAEVTSKRTLQQIVDTIQEIVESCCRKGSTNG